MEMYKAFASSTIGAYHIKKNICCQDAVGKYEDEKMNIVAVADGHGSPQYFRSDRGARFAVEAAIDCVKNFVNSFEADCENSEESIFVHKKNRDVVMADLQKSILVAWHLKVEQDFKAEPFCEEDIEKFGERYVTRLKKGKIEWAYGATIIVAVVTAEFWLALQIGDGKCVIVDDEKNVSIPIPEDPNCEDNITTSICQDEARDSFRYYLDKKIPVAVFLGSDGVEKSYRDDPDLLIKFYRSVVPAFRDNFDEGAKVVEDYLPVITQKGYGDDTSIAGIIHTEKIKACAEVFSEMRAEEKHEESMKDFDEKLQKKKTQFENNSAAIEELNAKISALEQLHATLSVDFERKNKEIDELKEKITSLEKEKEDFSKLMEEKKCFAEEIKREVQKIKTDMEAEMGKYKEEQLKKEKKNEEGSDDVAPAEEPVETEDQEKKSFIKSISEFLCKTGAKIGEEAEKRENTPKA